MRRVLIYAPGPEEGPRGLSLAEALALARPEAEIVVVTDVLPGPRTRVERVAPSGAVDWIRLPDLSGANPQRPLALEHLRGQRRRSLNTLFDRCQPGLLVVAGTEEAPSQEFRELLERAAALGRTTVFATPGGHEEGCRSELADASLTGCPGCRQTLEAALVEIDQLP